MRKSRMMTLMRSPVQATSGKSKPQEASADFYQKGTLYLQPQPSKTAFTFPKIHSYLQDKMYQQYPTAQKFQAPFKPTVTHEVNSFLPPPQKSPQPQHVQIPRPTQFLQTQNSGIVRPMIIHQSASLPQQPQVYQPQIQNYHQPSMSLPQQFLPQMSQFFPKGNYAALSNQFPHAIPFGTSSTSYNQQPPQWAPFSFHTTPSFDLSPTNQGPSWPFAANGPPPFLQMANPYPVEVLNYEPSSYSMDQYNFNVTINTDEKGGNSKVVSTESKNVESHKTSSDMSSMIETVDVGVSSKLQSSEFPQDSSSEVTQPVLTNMTGIDVSTNASSPSNSNSQTQSQLPTLSLSTNTNSHQYLTQSEGSETAQLNEALAYNQSLTQALSSEFSTESVNENDTSHVKFTNEDVEPPNESSTQFYKVSENNEFQSNGSNDSIFSTSESQSSSDTTSGSMTNSSTMTLDSSLFDVSNNKSKTSEANTLDSSSSSSSKNQSSSKLFSSSSSSSTLSSSSSSQAASLVLSSDASTSTGTRA